MAGCSVLWSLAGVFIKSLQWNSFAIACGRSLVAAVFILACLRGRIRLRFAPIQIFAGLASAMTMLLFVYANKATGAANAILLQYGAPIYTALIGFVFLKERPHPEQWIALAAVLGGMVLFFMDGLGRGHLAGDLAAVASGLTFAIYFVLMRAQKDGRPLESAFLANVLTAVIAFAFSLFLPAPRLDPKSVAIILVLGAFQIGLASALFAYGIKRAPALQNIIVAGIEPVLNPLWVFLATGETITGRSLAGGIIIIAAVMVSSVVTARRDAYRTQPKISP